MSERLSGLQLSNCIVDAEALIRANEHAYVDPDALQSARVQISMARELRERRSADLTDEEREALRRLAVALRERVERQRILTRIDDRYESALALLDKLLARKP